MEVESLNLRAASLAVVCLLLGALAFAQTQKPVLYPVVGGTESLPLSALAQVYPHARRSPAAATPCSAGGAFGNFTLVLNCDGNDSDGTTAYSSTPDTDMAVSEQYVIQTVDNVFTIYNKSDLSVVEGPADLALPWTGFEVSSCMTPGSGDDFIVRYDKGAARWVMALPIFGDAEGHYWLCLAVSTSSDPTGTYYLYAIQETGTGQPIWDYPKLGVWTDAYYIGFNMFSPKPAYLGSKACALDRTSMLAGAKPAEMQCFFESSPANSLMLPADIAGGPQPATGEPEFFLDIAKATANLHTTLNLWDFHVDFSTPANSTFSGPAVLEVAGFTEGSVYVAEPDGALNSRSDRLMVPLAWRQTSDGVEHLVVNHAVAAKGLTTTQWFDITSPASAPVVAQEGGLTPPARESYWMGSANMDQDGDIALGFSNSGSTIFPGISFTGRLVSDAPGTMEAVQSVISGAGYQEGSDNAWGDHSIMAVDPSDDCTFWYSNEYYSAAASGTDQFSTRIIEFKFTACPASGAGVLR